MESIVEHIGDLIVAQISEEDLNLNYDGLDFDEVIKISLINQIDSITLRGLASYLDEINEHKVKNILVQKFIISSQQDVELKKIVDLFERNHIKNQLLKGSVIKNYYPKPEMRQMSDIDILVDKLDLARASELISTLDYVQIGQESHHNTFMKGAYLRVEIHHSLYDSTVDTEQHDYFNGFGRSILKNGYDYSYEFTNEDFYVYMMAHMAKHFYKMGCGVRNLVDIYIFRRRFKDELNEVYIKEELRKNGILSFSMHMEILSDLWLNKKELSPFYRNVLEYMLYSGIYGKDENGIWNQFYKEGQKNNAGSKIRIKLWYFFPPVYYIKDYYPWVEKYPFFLPLAWVIRGFNGVIGKRGTKKREMLRRLEKNDIEKMQEIYREMKLDFHKMKIDH